MFEYRKETDSYHLTEDAPAWLRDAVVQAHFDMLPDDWVYAECATAFDAFDPEGEDDAHEHADSRVDVYTRDLAQWYADMCLTGFFAEAFSRAEELGLLHSDIDHIDQQLSVIQYCAICMITEIIWAAQRENLQEE